MDLVYTRYEGNNSKYKIKEGHFDSSFYQNKKKNTSTSTSGW